MATVKQLEQRIRQLEKIAQDEEYERLISRLAWKIAEALYKKGEKLDIKLITKMEVLLEVPLIEVVEAKKRKLNKSKQQP